MNRLFILALLLLPALQIQAQATRVKKVVLEGFWWDYKNDNFPNGWANYLTELAPRLKGMGVDAIWIPPSVKNQDFGQKGVGYAPYDHYDLGDKFQKNDATTRLGTKDDLLRMVAVLHANGVEVIQDIVPNHVIGAGSDTGGGGQDPAAPNPTPVFPNTSSCTDTWKNFRYTCYETPATTQLAADYLARKGRFPKNHQNFHPNPDHACSAGLCSADADADCWQGFGPDVCYFDGAEGQSSNATYNPTQSTYSPYGNGGTGASNGYMRKHTREWLVWYKKQMGFDGVRIDAVKHFPAFASEDFLYNLQHNADWASGDDKMFAVGEWVGGNSELNAWTAAVQNRAGTFDFNLRAYAPSNGGLYAMIYGNSGYDIGDLLPGAQQTTRYVDISGVRIHRTVPFVNNHDTYRPIKAMNGNITGWDSGNELSAHVAITEPRLGGAYAAMCAMDGNPQVFFEDLFNIANTGKRFSHQPENTTDLPGNSDIANIMLAHGALDFKGGDYKVRSSSVENTMYNVVTGSCRNSDANSDNDILVIERSGKAIIGVTDRWDVDQEVYVNTDFPAGTILKDYSGGYNTTVTVFATGADGCTTAGNRVQIKTRAVAWPDDGAPGYNDDYSDSYVDHGAHYHGYSIWAPVGIDMNAYSNAALPTTQEWEMENDLGDSHCQSLGQGGRTPDNSPNERVVGKIFSKQNSSVSYTLFLGSPGTSLTLEFYDLSGNLIDIGGGMYATYSTAGSSLSGSFTNTATRWITIKVRNTSAATAGQKCRVKVTYEAPEVVNTVTSPATNTAYIWNSNGGSNDWNDCHNWEGGLIPPCATPAATAVIPHDVLFLPSVPVCFTGTVINNSSLPLELLEFTAQAKEKHIALRWKTASEQDFSGFELQRSADGAPFEKINWIAAKGGVSNTYNYDDHHAQPGILYYYRLKMLDEDGQFSYSGLQSAQLDKGWGKPVVAPNPTRGITDLTFDAPNAGSGKIEVMDAGGRQVLEQNITFTKGTNTTQLNLSSLSKGTYVVQFSTANAQWNVRVVKR
ncbi:MAG TPA: alpha-amylase family glycosyl hydrolase [Saprospiraceae bacterium]|nr:alpha-amylase family glycosyl hydrolase [Saprospiraceae bacterium]HPI08552.1 alpha-amylase family glycosyl hydrolase [Saprospiraceae bacterium]